MDNNWFTTYVIVWFMALWLSLGSASLVKRAGSTSKYGLSVTIDRFTLTVKLTPAEVRRRLAATINPFTSANSAPYSEQWITSDSFMIDRFAKSRLLYTHGEIWPHPEGALINVTLRTSALVLVLLPFLVVNPLAISSLVFLILSLGFSLLLGGHYYHRCLTETRRAKTFLTNLLDLTGSDETPAAKPDILYQEPILYNGHSELEKDRDRLTLTYGRRPSGSTVVLVVAIMWAGVMLALIFGVVREVQAGRLGIFLVSLLVMLCGSPVLFYYGLADWLNRRVVTLTRQSISVRDQPLPFFRNITIPTVELKQLYPKRVVVFATKYGRKEIAVTYELRVILKNNKHITLLSEFSSPEEVIYTKQQIEAWLRLNNCIFEESL